MVTSQVAPGAERLRAARPTILLEGREEPALAGRLIALRATDMVGQMARCELTVSNWGVVPGGVGFLYFDRQQLDFGRRLQVQVDGDDGAITLFDGRITALEARFPEQQAAELTVLAEDRLQDLRMTRRTRSFENQSDAEVVRHIAGDHGLTPEVELPGPAHRHLAQVNQSDLAFLLDRCRLLDADLWVEDRTLHAVTRNRRGGRPITMTHGRQLYALTVGADVAHQFTSLQVAGWDSQAKEAAVNEARDDALGSEAGGDNTGASVLSTAFGDRVQSIAHTGPWSTEEARGMAESLFRQGARQFVRGYGTAAATLGLAVGRSTRIEGVGSLFEGTYTVVEVTHLYDATEGLRTAFAVERPGLGRP